MTVFRLNVCTVVAARLQRAVLQENTVKRALGCRHDDNIIIAATTDNGNKEQARTK